MANEHYEQLNDLSVDDAISAVQKTGQIELAVSKDFWGGDDQYEGRESELYNYFDKKETEFSSKLGSPSFRGGMEDEGFPGDFEERFSVHADYLVIWAHAGERYGLSIVQPDAELPFIVSFLKFTP